MRRSITYPFSTCIPLYSSGKVTWLWKMIFSKLQLAAEAGLIAGFQEAGPEMTMHLDCCPDNLFTDCVGGVLYQSHGPSRNTET